MPNRSPHVAALLNDRVKKSLDRVTRTTTPVYVLRSGALRHVGSGVLVRVRDEPFLFTAGHVADASDEGELCIAAQNAPVMVHGAKTVTKLAPGMQRTDDHIDVAVIRLAAATAAALATDEFLSLDEVVTDTGPRHDDFFLAAGYPGSRHKLRPERSEIEANLYPLIAVSAQADRYILTGHDPSRSLILGFKKEDTWQPDKGRVTAPDLHGMSGCGVWWLEGYTKLELSPPRLAAIAIEWHFRRDKYILATRASVALGGVLASV